MAKGTQDEFETFAKQKPRLTVLTDHALSVDRAKTSADTFNLRLEVGPVYDIIRYKRTRTPMAVLISGGWGTGKTSAMRWLEGLLDIWNQEAGKNDIRVRTVWFYPWKYDNKEDVRRGLIAEVIINSIDVKTASTQTVINAAKRFGLFLGKSFLHVLASIKLKGEVSGGAGATKAGAGAEVDLASIKEILAEYQQAAHPEKAYLNEFETMLQRWVKNTLGKNERMVIFIDDLDRCMPEISLQVLEALKLYLNIEKLIFVVGVDKQVIEKLVIEHYKKLGLVKSEKETESKKKDEDRIQRKEAAKAIQYLAKMFQVEVTLEPTEKQISDFFDEQLKELAYWRRPYLSTDEQQLFRDLVLKSAGRNPREVKRLLNSALMTGAGAMMMRKDGIKFDQGLQLFFVRKILDERYTMASAAGSSRGIDFFVQWSRIVRAGRKKAKDFPCTVKIPKDFGKAPLEEAREIDVKLTEPSEEARKSGKEVGAGLSFAPSRYHRMLRDNRFSGLLHLLADEDLGRLMQIPYPAEAAEVAAVVGTTKDAEIVREAMARQLGKKPDELTEDDYRTTKELDLSGSSISDLTPLESLTNLQEIVLSHTPVADAGPLISITNLQKLDLSSTQVSDVGPLASLANLQWLTLYGTQVSDLRLLASLSNLKVLVLSETPVRRVDALGGLINLQRLYLDGTQVVDVDPLASLTNLQRLDLDQTLVVNVKPISSLTNLRKLDLSGTQVIDVSPLASLKNLEELGIDRTRIGDISVLAELKSLRILSLCNTKVSDMGVLSGLGNLEELYINDTQVRDISMLKDLPNLQILALYGTQVSDEQVFELGDALPMLRIKR